MASRRATLNGKASLIATFSSQLLCGHTYKYTWRDADKNSSLLHGSPALAHTVCYYMRKIARATKQRLYCLCQNNYGEENATGSDTHWEEMIAPEMEYRRHRKAQEDQFY